MLPPRKSLIYIGLTAFALILAINSIFAQPPAPDPCMECLTPNSAETSFTIYPKSFVLDQNRPNPFSTETSISYFLPKDSYKNHYIEIVDMNGNSVFKFDGLIIGELSELKINAKNMVSGTYFYQLVINSELKISKQFRLIK